MLEIKAGCYYLTGHAAQDTHTVFRCNNGEHGLLPSSDSDVPVLFGTAQVPFQTAIVPLRSRSIAPVSLTRLTGRNT